MLTGGRSSARPRHQRATSPGTSAGQKGHMTRKNDSREGAVRARRSTAESKTLRTRQDPKVDYDVKMQGPAQVVGGVAVNQVGGTTGTE